MTEYDIQLKAGAQRPLEEAISEVTREFNVRTRCYPRWIDDGKIDKTDANDRLKRLESAVQFLKYFQDWIAADDARSKMIEIGKQLDPHPPQTGGLQSIAQNG